MGLEGQHIQTNIQTNTAWKIGYVLCIKILYSPHIVKRMLSNNLTSEIVEISIYLPKGVSHAARKLHFIYRPRYHL